MTAATSERPTAPPSSTLTVPPKTESGEHPRVSEYRDKLESIVDGVEVEAQELNRTLATYLESVRTPVPPAPDGGPMKLKPLSGGNVAGWSFWCPGCGHSHVFYTSGPMTWSFNGDLEKPTFTPSLLNTCEKHPDPKQRRCHLFVTDGRIIYCADSAHDLAGQTADLVDHWDDSGHVKENENG